jgi:DNA-binding response OmpR family regulator
MPAVVLLLVEDEALIQEMLELGLTDAGFEVVVASNGTQAITILDADVARFRAVITDVKLGSGPDGWEIARHARELEPKMPIVYMSGDSNHEWSSKGVPSSLIVAKPFAPAQLVTAVSTVINDADTS